MSNDPDESYQWGDRVSEIVPMDGPVCGVDFDARPLCAATPGLRLSAESDSLFSNIPGDASQGKQ
jgi:hypothetical protein